MVKIILISLVTVLTASSAFAVSYGKVLSKGSDCNTVNVKSAYFTSAGGEKSMTINLSVEDLSYDKRIWLQMTPNQGGQAVWNDYFWQYPVTAKYEASEGNRDLIRLITYMVGPNDYYKIGVYVTMNGQEYSCSSVEIGE